MLIIIERSSTRQQGRNHGFKVEGSEREPSRGAEGAEGVVHGEGVCPSPLGDGSGEGPCPLPRNFFLIFYLKMVSFDAFWVALPRCM